MDSTSSKTESETSEIASTAEPIETTTVRSDVSSSPNNENSGESDDEDSYPDEEDERKARLYCRNLYFSHGFLVEEGIRPPRLLSIAIMLKPLDSERSPVKGRTLLQYAQDMVKLSLRKYNALNGTDVKLDHVVRVTQSFTGTWVSYITFMARETDQDEGDGSTLVEYQAKVAKKLKRKTYPMFCRPSPKLDLDM